MTEISGPSVEITDEHVQEFKENGVICLKGAFSEEWVHKVSKGIERNFANPGKYSQILFNANSLGCYFNDYFNWRKIPEFHDFVYNSPAAEISGKLMRSKEVVFYHEHVFTKDPMTDREPPWHQDQSYYPIDGWQNCTLWIPALPVAKSACIQFVKGSHQWGKWFVPRNFETDNNYIPMQVHVSSDRLYENVPDIDKLNAKGRLELLSWELQPGDCIAFHMLTVHGKSRQTSTAPRKVLATRWLGDDAQLVKRPWSTSPPVRGGLRYGERIRKSAEFPVILKQKTAGC